MAPPTMGQVMDTVEDIGHEFCTYVILAILVLAIARWSLNISLSKKVAVGHGKSQKHPFSSN